MAQLYALGAFDSAMVLYYDRELLAQAGVEPPAGFDGWTWDEFLDACAKLKAAGLDPVALHMDITGDEWYTYAFSPVVWSAGGRLISADGRRVLGVLNTPENAETLRRWRQVFELDYASRAPIDPDPFGSGKTAMDWSGHWMARSHLEHKGARLGAMPLPTMGTRYGRGLRKLVLGHHPGLARSRPGRPLAAVGDRSGPWHPAHRRGQRRGARPPLGLSVVPGLRPGSLPAVPGTAGDRRPGRARARPSIPR